MNSIISFLNKSYGFFSLSYEKSFLGKLIDVLSLIFTRLIDASNEILLKAHNKSLINKLFIWFINKIKESYIFQKSEIIYKKFDSFLAKKIEKVVKLFNSSFFINLNKFILNQFKSKTFCVFFILTIFVALINLLLKLSSITSLFFKFLLILLSLNVLFLFLEKYKINGK